MENNKKIKVALFYAGSHLEEKTVEAENEEEYSSLIGCKNEYSLYSLSYQSLKIGSKTYAIFYDNEKTSLCWYGPDSIPSVTNDNFGYILYGNVIISNKGKNGFSSLTKADFENIQNHIGYLTGWSPSKVFLFPALRTNDETIDKTLMRDF